MKVYKIYCNDLGHLFNMESNNIEKDISSWCAYHGYSKKDYHYKEAPEGAKGKKFNF